MKVSSLAVKLAGVAFLVLPSLVFYWHSSAILTVAWNGQTVIHTELKCLAWVAGILSVAFNPVVYWCWWRARARESRLEKALYQQWVENQRLRDRLTRLANLKAL